MKFTLKTIKKITKKIEGISQTFYQCVLEGGDPSGIFLLHGKLTLESSDPGILNDIVRQVIGAEVVIGFSRPQVTLERFVEQ